jgi:hypothetical protein
LALHYIQLPKFFKAQFLYTVIEGSWKTIELLHTSSLPLSSSTKMILLCSPSSLHAS